MAQAAAPLNPSDLGFMRARARGATYPAVCGNEGSGTVSAAHAHAYCHELPFHPCAASYVWSFIHLRNPRRIHNPRPFMWCFGVTTPVVRWSAISRAKESPLYLP